MMSGTIEAILEVYKREKKPDEPLDPQTLTTIAKNSYPFLVELASHHLAVLNKIGKFLFIQRSEEKLHLLKIMPEYLTLIQSKNGYRLGFTPEAQKKIDQIIAEHDKTDDKSPLVRCIGLQNVEGNSMIKDMWDWHIEVAPDVYAVALKQPLAS